MFCILGLGGSSAWTRAALEYLWVFSGFRAVLIYEVTLNPKPFSWGVVGFDQDVQRFGLQLIQAI